MTISAKITITNPDGRTPKQLFTVQQVDGAALEADRLKADERAMAAAQVAADRIAAEQERATRIQELRQRRQDLCREAARVKRQLENAETRRAQLIAGLITGDLAEVNVTIAETQAAHTGVLRAIDELDKALADLGQPSGQHRRVFMGGNL